MCKIQGFTSRLRRGARLRCFPSLRFWQVSAWRFVLNNFWWCLTNTSSSGHDFCFLPIPSPKPVQLIVHFGSHIRANAACYTLTMNPGFSVSIDLGRNLCWHVVLSWCCTTITTLLFHYPPNVSYLLVWGPNILMNKASSLWHSCYTFDHMLFKEIALHVSKGKSHLNFPHAGWHLLIVASSQYPPGEIQSPR